MSQSEAQVLASLEKLAREALQAWDIEGAELSLIKHRENAVYSAQTQSGERFALRLHRLGYHSDEALHSELIWIDALAKSGIEVPKVIPTTDNQLFITVGPADESWQVDLFEWVDGEQLGSLEHGLGEDEEKIRNIFFTIGESAARLHNQSCRWEPPAGFKRHAWDLEGLVGEAPFWGRFWELNALSDEQHQLVNRARAQIKTDLENYGQNADNYSLIHADFVPENLLVDGEHVRLIDFDDAGFGWHMFELATALYFIQGEAHYELAKQALLEGYREHRALSDKDLAALPLFLAARGFTYLGWVQSRQETQTAREMTPELVALACDTARGYLGE